MITLESQQLALNLLSGLLGSIVGSLIGYKGAMNAAREQINHLYDLEKQKRKLELKDQEAQILRSLIVEAQENNEIATSWKTNHAKTLMNKESWNLYKGSIRSLASDLRVILLKAYSEINRYNALVEYDRMKIPFGHGGMDAAIQQQAAVVKTALTELLSKLE